MEIITRKQAKEIGERFYYSGKLCKYNHNCQRYTCNKQCLECVLIYNETTRLQKRQYDEIYYKKNKEQIRIKHTKYVRKRRKEDVFFRLNNNISRSIRNSLFVKKSRKHWEEFVDFTIEELKLHLQSLWEPWMNWDNYGKYDKNKKTWQIDHIKPISLGGSFKEIWKLENLQPLESLTNIKKGNKYKIELEVNYVC